MSSFIPTHRGHERVRHQGMQQGTVVSVLATTSTASTGMTKEAIQNVQTRKKAYDVQKGQDGTARGNHRHEKFLRAKRKSEKKCWNEMMMSCASQEEDR